MPVCLELFFTITLLRFVVVCAFAADGVISMLRYPTAASATLKWIPWVLRPRRRVGKNRFTPRLSNIVSPVSDYDFAAQHY